MAIPTIPDIRDLVEAGVHFGHASGRWHPKMKPYIFATRDKLHIINLEKTQEQLTQVLGVLEEKIRDGKMIVLVGTKKQVAEQIKAIGEANNVCYVCVRWLGGTMTNFGEMQKSISRMKRIEEFLASPEAAKTIKKERVMMENDLKRMQAKFGGLRNMVKKPDMLLIVDPGFEHNAVKEALCEGIEIMAIADTDSDPTPVNHLIVANDDGPKSLKLVLDLVEKTIQNGQKLIDLKREEKTAEISEAKEEKAEVTEDPKSETKVEDKKEEVKA